MQNVGGTVSQSGNADTSNVNLNNKASVAGEKQLELNKTKTDAVLHSTTQTLSDRKAPSNKTGRRSVDLPKVRSACGRR